MNRTPSSPDPAAGSLTAAAVAVAATLIVQIGIAVTGPLAVPPAALRSSVGAIGTLPAAPPAAEPIRVASARGLQRLFERLEYDLEAVVGGATVPPVELSVLPADLPDMASVAERKALFIRAVLPIVLRANDAVLAERQRLLDRLLVLEAGGALSAAGIAQTARIAERYGVPLPAPDADGLRRLLRRVDTVPVSLAVAQAIVESGWGTSRFARAGNALFGQWTWDSTAGIVPAARPAGRTHRVRAFGRLADSAHAYVFNLNTHPAYRGFRQAREAARRDGGALPSGVDLARQLGRYSERGSAYVAELRAVIRHNGLAPLDAAALGGVQVVAAAERPATDPAGG